MTPSWLAAFPDAEPNTICICQCMRGNLLIPGRAEIAEKALLDLASHAKEGFILESIHKGKPDRPATIWFARAPYQYKQVAGATPAWTGQIVPVLKKAVQSVVSGGASGFRMDDGGLLAPAAGGICPVGINALWYFLLSMLAEE